MRKRMIAATALLLPLCFMCACTKTPDASVSSEPEVSVSSSEEEVPEGIKEAIEAETSSVDTTPAGEVTKGTERVPDAEISSMIPGKYIKSQFVEGGTIEKISYTSKDYFGDKSDVEKEAYVYLPYGYDESKQYNVLYLMHGIGGDEEEWGMTGSTSRVKCIMDNLIYNGDIEPFIVVTPNGRSAKNHSKNGSDFNSFYVFVSFCVNYDFFTLFDKEWNAYCKACFCCYRFCCTAYCIAFNVVF